MKGVRITGLVLLVFLIVKPALAGVVVFVSGGGDALQLAINAAGTGDVLIVASGSYNKIDFKGKAITVTSTNPDDPDIVAGTIIDAGGVYLREEGSAVVNNLVYGNRADFAEGGGVYLRGASNCVVRGNTIAGNFSVSDGANLDIEFCDNVDVSNNIISDASNSAGVYLYSSTIAFGYNNV